MQESNISLFGIRYVYVAACLVVVVLGIHLFQMEDRYQVSLLVLAVVLAFMRSFPFKQWTIIDYCIITITLFDTISCLYAKCPIAAVFPAFYSIYMLTVYITCRILFISGRGLNIVMKGSSFLVGIALILSVSTFFIFRYSVLHTGFDDTYHFRFLFHPLGYFSNIWVEGLFLILGWVFLMRRYSIVFISLCLLGILLSFSRGAYVALSIYLISYFCLMPKGDKIRILIPFLPILVIVMLCCPREIHTTLLMNKTNSQKQSTESRVNGTKAAWKVFKKYPMLGYGNGNYTYALDSEMGQDSTKPLASIAPNTLVKILVEKGIIGVLIYALLALFVIRKLWRNREQADSKIIGCTLFAFFAKDMSQASWLDTPFIMLMVYLLLAYLQKDELMAEKDLTTNKNYLISGLAVIAFLFWNLPTMKQIIDSTSEYIRKGDYRNACVQHPEDLQLRYLYATRTLLNENPAKADSILQDLAVHYPKNSLYLSTYAERCYRNGDKETAHQMMTDAISYTPRLLEDERMQRWRKTDSLFYHRLILQLVTRKPTMEASAEDYARYGYIVYWYGDTQDATIYLRKAVEKLPNLATPWRLLGEKLKYNLLTYGIFYNRITIEQLPEQYKMDEQCMFDMLASEKIKTWYDVDINEVK